MDKAAVPYKLGCMYGLSINMQTSKSCILHNTRPPRKRRRNGGGGSPRKTRRGRTPRSRRPTRGGEERGDGATTRSPRLSDEERPTSLEHPFGRITGRPAATPFDRHPMCTESDAPRVRLPAGGQASRFFQAPPQSLLLTEAPSPRPPPAMPGTAALQSRPRP